MDEIKKNNVTIDGQKLVMTFIFIAATAVIFLGIGYMAGKNSGDSGDVSVATVSATAVAGSATTVGSATTATTTGTADVTAGWKTYTNETYGFSFKYPADWRKVEDSGEGLVQLYSGPEAGRELLDSETKIVVSRIDNSQNLTLDEHLQKVVGGATVQTSKDLTVGGKKSKEYVYSLETGGTGTVVGIPGNDSEFIEVFCYNNSDQLSTILSTFQLTK